MKKEILAPVLLLCAATPVAGATTPGLPYNFVEAAYAHIEFDDSDLDADGFGLGWSGLITTSIFAFGRYSEVETDRFGSPSSTLEAESITAGLGYRAALNAGADFNATAAYLHSKTDFKGGAAALGSNRENGFGLELSLRSLLMPMLEGRVGINYVDIANNDDTAFIVGLRFNITPAIAFGGDYAISSDANTYNLGLRLSF